ncbi:pilus assembly PilX family protein [Haliangium sp.]|uniref:pilus assembly PilX family protein n=1 Tax=Haliangium sp. TaxID=2663208 RepID=UPI003D129FFA
MHPPRALGPTRHDRGSALLVVVVAMLALASLGLLTVLTVRSGVAGASHDRFRMVALSAAEAGVAVAMDYLRGQYAPAPTHWSGLVNPGNVSPLSPLDLPGNTKQPGQAGNPFSPELGAWYEVTFLNNRDDGDYDAPPSAAQAGYQGYILGEDRDARIIVSVIGHGPNQAAARIDVEVHHDDARPPDAALRILGWQQTF